MGITRMGGGVFAPGDGAVEFDSGTSGGGSSSASTSSSSTGSGYYQPPPDYDASRYTDAAGNPIDPQRIYDPSYADFHQAEPTDPGKEWHSIDPAGYNAVIDWVKESYDVSGNMTGYKTRINYTARQFYDRNGRWPRTYELIGDGNLSRRIENVVSGFPTQAPVVFKVNGIAYYNNPMEGPTPYARDTDAALRGEGWIDHFGPMKPQAEFGSWDEVFANLKPANASRSGYGGRGGGSAAARPDRVWDRNQLIETATDRWKGLLLEDPDDDKIAQLADNYMDRANSFWVKEGGNLDFDTFVVDTVRKQGRYKQLYRKMGDNLTEEEWMARYRGSAEAFGQRDVWTRRQAESGLRSGAGLAGFNERLGKTAQGRAAAGGSFSRQLASTMAQMGEMG